MSTYKNLIGKDVNFLTTDPDNAQAEGQIWYNSTSNVFKDLITLNAWSNGGSLSTEHRDTSAAGTQTAGLCFSGSPPSGGITATEEYNGSGWGTGGALNTARRGAARFSASTQTAGLVFGGSGPPNPTVLNATEEYNGTAWTSVNNLPAVKYIHFGAGIQTAALSAGGYSGTAALATTEEYDGTNWSAGNAMGTARYSGGSAGTQTAGLIFGGTPPETAATEEYDGTNWTAGGSMLTAKRYCAGCGTQDAALVFGAGPTAIVKTEKYDGTSWTETADMGIAQKAHGGAGSQSAALSCGGESPSSTGLVTQEFNSSSTVFTSAAFSSGGSLNTLRGENFGYAGTQTAGVAFGGFAPSVPGATGKTESYNGTSFSEVNDMNTARWDISGDGPSSAAITAGGNGPNAQTEEWNGTSWTEVADLSTARRARTSGTQAAAIVGGGKDPVTAATEEWNGSSWTAGGAMNTPRGAGGQAGPQTATIVASGTQDPPNVGNVENYNGTSWTEDSDVVTPVRACQAAGQQDDLLLMAGTGAPSGYTQRWNGTSWVTDVNLGYNGSGGAGNGPSTAALNTGGGATTTVEYSPETTALNIKTITTS